MAKKYVQKWQVPSRSNPANRYTVSETDSGTYECSCPAWINNFPRKDCHHIKLAQANPELYGYEFKTKWPSIVLAKVKEVTRDGDNILTPLVPLNTRGFGFTVTVIYDLLRHGVPWSEVRERYGRFVKRSDGGATRKGDVIHWVHQHGRTVIEEFGSIDMSKPGPLYDVYKTTREGVTL